MLFYWLLVSAFKAQPSRWLISGFAVALGIALAVAIHTVNRSALSEFGRAIDLVNGQASAQLVMPSGDFPDHLFDEVVSRQTELGIRAVSPVLERNTQSVRVLGLDIFQAARVTPTLMPTAADGERLALFNSKAIFLSATALNALNVAVGDDLTLLLAGKKETFRVAGLVPGAAGQVLAVMDLGLAQWRLNGLGRLSRLDIQLAEGRNLADLENALAKSNLGFTIVTAGDRDRRMSNLSRAYRVNLNVLALVALFTGAFLVFTTMRFSVLRQQSQLALLGVLGASRKFLFSLVLTQAALVSAMGGAIGIGIGLAIASVLLHVFGGDLGAGYFSTVSAPLEIDAMALFGFWLLSVAVGILAGYFPAQAATAGAPMQQLRAGAAERVLRQVKTGRISVVFAVFSAVLALMPAIDGLPIPAYVSVAFALFAGIAFIPTLVSRFFSTLQCALSRWNGGSTNSAYTLAVWRLTQASASAAGLIAGVVAALALTVAMVVMVASFRDSVTQWLDQVLPADLYASISQSGLNQALLDDPQLLKAIAMIPEIARVEFTLQQKLLFRADRPEVALIARPVPEGRAQQVLPLTGFAIPAPTHGESALPSVFISEAMVDLYGWQPGQVHALPLPNGINKNISVWVSGVFRDYGRQHGAIVIDLARYQNLTHDLRRTDIAIWLKTGVSPSRFVGDLERQFPPFEGVKFRSATDLRALSLTIFDRSFMLTYALEIAALLVALFSVAAGFAGQALLRQKEFALLQHLGQSAIERFRWLTYESGMLLGLAVCWGIVLGLLMSQLLIHRVNPQSFGWTMDTSMPTLTLIGLALSIVILGITAAVWAANRNLNPYRLALSLREDW